MTAHRLIRIVFAFACGAGMMMSAACDEAPPSPFVPSNSLGPAVKSVSPTAGTSEVAATIRIEGSGFLPGATVAMDGAATNVVVVNSTTITATTPPHAAGVVAVVVTNPDGKSSSLPAAYTFADRAVVSSGSWELSGVAVGDDGRPISNAQIWVSFGYPAVGTMTDEMGRYNVTFDARQGAYVYRSTATVYVRPGPDYEKDVRLFRPTGSDRHQTLDLRPRLIRWITAGASDSVTVGPDDSPCFNNMQVGDSQILYFCRTVRLMAPADGVLTVEAVSDDPQALRLPLEVDPDPEGQACCYWGNPLTIPVTAGMLLKINVEIVEGTPGRTFKLTTTLR